VLLHIVARGRIGRSPEAELVGRYMKRITWPTRITELPETGGKAPPPAQSPAITVMLDECKHVLQTFGFRCCRCHCCRILYFLYLPT